MSLRIDLENDNRWKWFDNPKLGIRVELYGPKTDEFSAFAQRYGLGTGKADIPEMRRFIARHWFRAFEGFDKPNGEAHENTEAVRARVLDWFPEVWAWVLETIQTFSAWRMEGNAGSGSVS